MVRELLGLRKEMLSKVALLLKIMVLPIVLSAWTTILSSELVALKTRSVTTVLSIIGSKPAYLMSLSSKAIVPSLGDVAM